MRAARRKGSGKPDPASILQQGEYVSLLPSAGGLRKGLRYLRTGLLLGQLKNRRFRPSQALAMALKKEDWADPVDLSPEDPDVIRYLKGETVPSPDENGKGWRLFCTGGFPLGFVKQDGQRLKNGSAVQVKVNSFHPGDKAKLLILREGKEKTIDVTFQGSSSENGTVIGDGEIAFYGTTLKEAPKETLEKLGLSHGVLVTSVSTGKMLEAGASEGLVITYVNDQPVNKPQDVVDIAKAAKRSVYVEGVTANGRKAFFGFGKD